MKIFVLVQVHSHFRFGHNIVNFIAAVVVSVVLFFKLDGKFSNLNGPCSTFGILDSIQIKLLLSSFSESVCGAKADFELFHIIFLSSVDYLHCLLDDFRNLTSL